MKISLAKPSPGCGGRSPQNKIIDFSDGGLLLN